MVETSGWQTVESTVKLLVSTVTLVARMYRSAVAVVLTNGRANGSVDVPWVRLCEATMRLAAMRRWPLATAMLALWIDVASVVMGPAVFVATFVVVGEVDVVGRAAIVVGGVGVVVGGAAVVVAATTHAMLEEVGTLRALPPSAARVAVPC